MTLALTRLRLSHFRSHLLTDLEFNPGPVAIFGPNGAGKTNLIEAISLLSPGRGLRRATADALPRTPESIGWRIGAEIIRNTGTVEVDIRAEPGLPRQTRIDDKSVSQTALGRVARVLWLVPSMDRLWIEGAEGRRRFLDRITLSFTPDHADHSLAYEKAMRERNRLLRDGIEDPRWYAALERRMAESGAAIITGRQDALRRLERAQDGAATSFPAADLALVGSDPNQADPETAEDLAAALAGSRGRDLRAGRSLVGPHRADLHAVYTAKSASAATCSTGEQKALLISLILANARALARDLGFAPILLLDEVAAHLDGARRAALYDEITGLGAQAFLTGTEAALFDDLGVQAQRIEMTDRVGVSLALLRRKA